MHAEELWTGNGFNAWLCRTLLTPASWIYALGWQGYLAMYRLGVKKAKAPHSPVVCVGNLQVGGTGKTPATIHLADVLLSMGREVVVSCSGYGSPASEAARLAPSGPLDAGEWGDEAALFRWLRPELPLIVGRRRVLAAETCHREFPTALLLMDDGFQHLPLKKHLTIVLDPPSPNRRCLPAGPYREPWSNRGRADVVIPGDFRIEAAPMGFIGPDGRPRTVGGSVCVLCALGRPRAFLAGLSEALSDPGSLTGVESRPILGGAPPLTHARKTRSPRAPSHSSEGRGIPEAPIGPPSPVTNHTGEGGIGRVVLRPDHDPLTEGNLLSSFQAGATVVVTGKDWVKLRRRPDIGTLDIAIATREVAIEPRDSFRDWLQAKLDGIPEKEQGA